MTSEMRHEKTSSSGSIRKGGGHLYWGAAVLVLVLLPSAFASATPHQAADGRPNGAAAFGQAAQKSHKIELSEEQKIQAGEPREKTILLTESTSEHEDTDLQKGKTFEQEAVGGHAENTSEQEKTDKGREKTSRNAQVDKLTAQTGPEQAAQPSPQHKQEKPQAAVSTHSAADQHAGDTPEGEHEAQGGSGFLAKLVNFLVLFGGLTFLLRKPISNLLGQRAEDVRTSMTEAEETNTTAQQKLKQGQKRLDEMAVEVERINVEAEEAGHKEKEGILAAAAQEVERLKKLAVQEIAILSQVGIKELKSHAAELSTSIARENIRKKIKTADQASLIDKSIDRLEALNEEKTVL
jgi:F-type H+-transporting ATPase subunit b